MKLAHLILSTTIALASASAAPVIFSGFDLGLGELTPLAAFPNSLAAEIDFKSSLITSETETFESFTDGQKGPLNLSFSTVTATLDGGITAAIRSVPVGMTNGVGRYGVSGTNFWHTSTDSFTISFSKAVTAFGFYGVDVGDFVGDLTISVGGVTYDLNTANRPGGSVLFWGIIDKDNPFTEISFANTKAGTDFFAFDNMTVNGDVPEPSTFMLMAGGAALAAFARWFRR